MKSAEGQVYISEKSSSPSHLEHIGELQVGLDTWVGCTATDCCQHSSKVKLALCDGIHIVLSCQGVQLTAQGVLLKDGLHILAVNAWDDGLPSYLIHDAFRVVCIVPACA